MSAVYPECPHPDCDYVNHGQPVRVRPSASDEEDNQVDVLVTHTVRNEHRHRALVTIHEDGTQRGRLLSRGERFEEVAV